MRIKIGARESEGVGMTENGTNTMIIYEQITKSGSCLTGCRNEME